MRVLQFILVLGLVLVLSGSAQVMACWMENCMAMAPAKIEKKHACCEKASKEQAPPKDCEHCLKSQQVDRSPVVREVISPTHQLNDLALPCIDVPAQTVLPECIIPSDHAPPPILLNLVQQSCQLNF
jgi:hypothetical protein